MKQLLITTDQFSEDQKIFEYKNRCLIPLLGKLHLDMFPDPNGRLKPTVLPREIIDMILLNVVDIYIKGCSFETAMQLVCIDRRMLKNYYLRHFKENNANDKSSTIGYFIRLNRILYNMMEITDHICSERSYTGLIALQSKVLDNSFFEAYTKNSSFELVPILDNVPAILGVPSYIPIVTGPMIADMAIVDGIESQGFVLAHYYRAPIIILTFYKKIRKNNRTIQVYPTLDFMRRNKSWRNFTKFAKMAFGVNSAIYFCIQNIGLPAEYVFSDTILFEL